MNVQRWVRVTEHGGRSVWGEEGVKGGAEHDEGHIGSATGDKLVCGGAGEGAGEDEDFAAEAVAIEGGGAGLFGGGREGFG